MRTPEFLRHTLKPLIIRKVHTMTFANKFGMFIHWGLYSQLGLHEQAL